MVLSIFKNKAAKAAMAAAKNDYVKAAELNDDSRTTRAYKVRIGIRCRSHIDKVFIEAAKKNVAIIVRVPLASGLLTGKMNIQSKFPNNDHRNYNIQGQHI